MPEGIKDGRLQVYIKDWDDAVPLLKHLLCPLQPSREHSSSPVPMQKMNIYSLGIYSDKK